MFLELSDNEICKHLIVGDVLISPARFGKLLFKNLKISGILRFDADQHRAKITRRLLQIFKTGNVVFRSKKIEERAQSARTLRKTEDEIFLQTFIAKCAFFDVWQSFKVEITARYDDDNTLAFDFAFLEILERINTKSTGRFKHDALNIEHFDHG